VKLIGGRAGATARAAVAALLAALAVFLAGPAYAAPSDTVTKAVEGLRNDHLYVDPAQNTLTAAQVAQVRQAVESASSDIYLAVLPAASSSTEADGLPKQIYDGLGKDGTYAVVAGRHFAAGSTELRSGVAMGLAHDATQTGTGDIAERLTAFVSQVQDAVSQQRSTGAPAGSEKRDGFSSEKSKSGSGAGIVLLILLLAGGTGAFLFIRKANRDRLRRQREELAQVRTAVDEDITAYGEELDRLDFSPSAPGVDDAMRADYGRALDAYENAKREIEIARRPEDVRGVTAALEEGRFALASLAARREGRPLPERRPPCFFDPRHGPSVQDAEWAPPGGMPRQVPVCAADAARLADGLDPMVRTVEVAGGGRRPYWDAGPAYGPWAGGYFGGYGSMLLPGLLVGTLLGSSFGSPMWGADAGGWGGDSGFDNGGGGGDFGGGDFGGGDFGGGDF
jgi:hypothetical protein